MYLKGKVRFDQNNDVWVDVYDSTIQDIQRASLMGGLMFVYHLINDDYRLGFNYINGRTTIQFLGCAITKQQFETQMKLWKNKNHIVVTPNTELCLIDNQYFV